MKEVNKLEDMIASWYKDVPHLPNTGQIWLADNVWWLALVGLILGSLAVLGTIMFSFFIGAAFIALGGPYGALVGGVAVIATLVLLAFSIISLVLIALAISSLRVRARKGWRLLFLAILVNIAALILDFLLTFNLFGLIWGLLAATVGTYFLFEIRSHFMQIGPAKNDQAPPKKAI